MEKDQILVLEELFNRYFSHLVLYSRKLIKNSEAAEDIVQDVFLRLFESGRLKQVSPSFLFTCVKNASLNYLHSSLNKYIPISSEQDQIPDKEIQEEIDHMKQLEQLDEAIEALPDKCKDIFTRVYLQQQRYEDVAVQLNISYHTVKAHMSTAFKHLRKQLLLLLIFFRNVKS
ncbi:sigma-70 family RNA polymerase sigma factor [uncultured Sanguibacteroides sp.]|uniref:RNA polymerase sigma factor n=1 Tax=uncultured Sanguibacteroides sp. TaxID=1635151 RepID=UPI0025D2B434|nr:sigma-70 family RNA polymerase sigma factor [uncultured Sanguibacteroides sp.]